MAYIKPVKGKRVRLPNGYILRPEGQEIKLNQYLYRRINDGDIEVIENDKIDKKK